MNKRPRVKQKSVSLSFLSDNIEMLIWEKETNPYTDEQNYVVE
jgi:hypothetical protein